MTILIIDNCTALQNTQIKLHENFAGNLNEFCNDYFYWLLRFKQWNLSTPKTGYTYSTNVRIFVLGSVVFKFCAYKHHFEGHSHTFADCILFLVPTDILENVSCRPARWLRLPAVSPGRSLLQTYPDPSEFRRYRKEGNRQRLGSSLTDGQPEMTLRILTLLRQGVLCSITQRT
jgi:hypothetical protein